MMVRAVCDECRKPVGENEIIYYRKNCEETFCSQKCVEKHVIKNTEIRTK